MPVSQYLNDERLLKMSTVNKAVARERLIDAYLGEDPERQKKYDALDEAGQTKIRENLSGQFSQANQAAFSVELTPAKEEEKTVSAGMGGRGVTVTDKTPAVTRPLYDPRTEAMLDGFNSGKVDSNLLDDDSFEQLIPFAKANMTEEDFGNFVSPYRERLLKKGIRPDSYMAKAAIQGSVPDTVRRYAEAVGGKYAKIQEKAMDAVGISKLFTLAAHDHEEEKERYGKWKTAYGDVDESMKTAGAVAGLVGGGVGLAGITRQMASKSARLATQLAGAGALDYAYAKQLPGFSADLFESPTAKALATVGEGMAITFAGGAIGKRLMGGKPKRVNYGKAPDIDIKYILDEPNPYQATKKAGAMKQAAGNLLTPISTRLENISPRLKYAERRFELGLHKRDYEYKKQVEPWLNGQKKMTKEERLVLDIAERNGDVDTIDGLVKKYHLQDAYASKRAALDGLEGDLKAVGYEIGHIENYAPRRIDDVDGLMRELKGDKGKWGAVSKAIKDAEKARGVSILSQADQAEIANGVIVRPYAGGKPGNLKARKFDVVPERYRKFYKSSNDALFDYIDSVVTATEKRKFLGKHMKGNDVTELAGPGGDVRTVDGIGGYVADLVRRGQILPWQEREVIDILEARLVQRPGNEALKAAKGLAYIDTMGSPISAVTQIGDMAFSAHKNGYFATLDAAFGKKRVKMEDVYIHNVAAEFSEGKIHKAVDKVFTATGLNKIDRLGKETLLNSTLTDLERTVKPTAPRGSKAYGVWKKKYDKLGKELVHMFGPEANKVIKDLARGEVTENVRLLLGNRLLDMQPVALSEVPAAYLKVPNMRIAYMLKTFTIKQLDVFRREAFREIRRGNVKQGLKNLTRLGGAFMLFNMGADQIKDMMLGRKTELSDAVMDNLLRTVGVSKFAIYDARRSKDGLRTAMMLALPPTKLARGLQVDVGKMMDGQFKLRNSESIQSVPLVGKFWYWWFGGGAEKRKKNN